MTDEQINTAIAETCGWKGNVLDRDMEGNLWPSDPPRYCTDLNAMHEAEKLLTTDQFYAYSAWIDRLAPKREYRAYLGATARQRAEAFLRTLGKWRATDKEFLTVGGAITEQSSVDHLRDATKMMEVQK